MIATGCEKSFRVNRKNNMSEIGKNIAILILETKSNLESGSADELPCHEFDQFQSCKSCGEFVRARAIPIL